MSFPFLPGIPPLLEKIIPAVVTLAAGPLADLLQSLAPVWGIYDQNGNEVIKPDTFVGIQYTNSHRISDYPIEKGSFAYYNSVQDPFNATVRMAKGGSEEDRTKFLYTIDQLSKSLALYTVVTPEWSYLNLSIERYDYIRSATNGAGMITVDVRFVEIRLAQLQYSPTETNVPAAQITNPTTTLGTPSPTATVPQAQGVVHVGQIAPSPAPPLAVQQYNGGW